VAAGDQREYAYTFGYEVNYRCVLGYRVAKYIVRHSVKFGEL